MTDFLSKLIKDAETRILTGYYDTEETKHQPTTSLAREIKTAPHNAIIAEIKPISPARGPIRPTLDPVDTALRLQNGGAIGLSILTEPDNFGGSLTNLSSVRSRVKLPLLMKDIVINDKQIIAAKNSGADCILLIQTVLSRKGIPPADPIKTAHDLQLEVLLEIHNNQELGQALGSDAEIIGINNRNLTDLQIDLKTTTKLLETIKKPEGKVIITESGLETVEDIRKLKKAPVDGFLIGSSIMLANDIESKVREFVLA
ncbi:MAG: indole-3-glycerol-phosphate synthase [Candidatus Bathyarchaeia archaeon]|jgi:indole-3-glycerol phosphate synthase